MTVQVPTHSSSSGLTYHLSASHIRAAHSHDIGNRHSRKNIDL